MGTEPFEGTNRRQCFNVIVSLGDCNNLYRIFSVSDLKFHIDGEIMCRLNRDRLLFETFKTIALSGEGVYSRHGGQAVYAGLVRLRVLHGARFLVGQRDLDVGH